MRFKIMKTTTKIAESVPKSKFPLLAIGTGLNSSGNRGDIVLFINEHSGTVIHQSYGRWPIGHFSDGWVNVNSALWKILPADSEVALIQE